MSAGTRSGKYKKNTAEAKTDNMLPSASAQTPGINLDSGDDSTDIPNIGKVSKPKDGKLETEYDLSVNKK